VSQPTRLQSVLQNSQVLTIRTIPAAADRRQQTKQEKAAEADEDVFPDNTEAR
jgi:hypothetical protein